jgi:hypothetical protein
MGKSCDRPVEPEEGYRDGNRRYTQAGSPFLQQNHRCLLAVLMDDDRPVARELSSKRMYSR